MEETTNYKIIIYLIKLSSSFHILNFLSIFAKRTNFLEISFHQFNFKLIALCLHDNTHTPHSMHFFLSMINFSFLFNAPTGQASTHPTQAPPQLQHFPFFQQHFSKSIFIGMKRKKFESLNKFGRGKIALINSRY